MKKHHDLSRAHATTILGLLAGVIIGLTTLEGNCKSLGSTAAKVGGHFYYNLDMEPSGLNPLRGLDGYSSDVTTFIFDTLMARDLDTLEWKPAVATKFVAAKDGMSYTFTIRDDAKFHDGSPVTVEDVKFSFDANFNPKLADAMFKMYYEAVDRAEIIDSKTIKFYIKTKYYKNFDLLGGLTILPQKIYGDPDKKVSKTAIGSGAYKLEKFDQGQKIILKRNPDWWGFKTDFFKNWYNFDQITFRFITDRTAQLESMKKGDLSYMMLSPEQYEKQTDGAPWGQTVMKAEVMNVSPKRTSFVGMNMRKPLFKDREVRHALSQLFNREFMIEKFFYNKSLPATGPWFQQSPDANPAVKAVKFDPASAKEKLKKAGWVDSDKDGVLDQVFDGKKTDFRFTIMHGGAEWEKYLTVYKEELKKAGIDIQLKQLEWNAFQQAIHSRNFDAIAISWTGVVDGDPKQIWHSTSEANKGSNFGGYSNPKVDKMIDEVRVEMNQAKRRKLLQKIYAEIANDHPYVFFANPKFDYYAYSAKLKRVKPSFNYDVGKETWWFSE